MKKCYILVMTIAMMLMFVACSNDKTIELKNGVYNLVNEDNEVGGHIVINDDTFYFCYDLTSSYLPYGTYEIKDNQLTLETDDSRHSYSFYIEGDDFIFIEVSSSSVKVNDERLSHQIIDGDIFRLDYKNDNLTDDTSDAVEISNVYFVQIGSVDDSIMALEFENLEKLAISSEKHLLVRRITSRDEMNKVSEIIANSKDMSLNPDTNHSLEKVFNQYDNSYFEENNLMIILIEAQQLKDTYEVAKVEMSEDDVLKVYIDDIMPQMGGNTTANWMGILEIKKEYFTDNTKLDAVFMNNY